MPRHVAIVLVVATGLMFGYFAVPALEESESVTLFMGRTSLLLIPVVLLASWRRNVLSALPAPALLSTGDDSRARLAG